MDNCKSNFDRHAYISVQKVISENVRLFFHFNSVSGSSTTCGVLLGLLLIWTCNVTGVVSGRWTWTGGGDSLVFILSRRYNNIQTVFLSNEDTSLYDALKRYFIITVRGYMSSEINLDFCLWRGRFLESTNNVPPIGWFAISRSLIGGGEFSTCVARGNHRK